MDRNIYNQLPAGNLIQIEENIFSDKNENKWELQPNNKNLFHQPSGVFTGEMLRDIETPYSILNNPPEIDFEYPNIKLLCIQEDGSSFEAILRPNNEYVITGKIRGTYNYASPNGFWGALKHTILDVIPHFICSDYK